MLLNPWGQVIPNREIASNVTEHVVCDETFAPSSQNPWCYRVQNWWVALWDTHQWKQHLPFQGTIQHTWWCFRMPITFFFSFCPFFCWLDPSKTSVPPLETGEGHQTVQALSSGIRSLRPLPPVTVDRIRDNDSHRDPFQEGGHYADMSDEWWTRTSPRWLTIRRGCEETGSLTSDALCRTASLAHSPLGITIAHYGGRRVELKNNPISHSSSVDIQSV